MTSSVRDHSAVMEQYVNDVLTGVIPSCQYVKQACERHRRDITHLAGHPLYTWDAAKGARVCRFLERLPHVKGPLANADELLVLGPWQVFIIMSVFGWRRKDNGGRRFKRVYIEVPRGNGKSALSSGIALYGLAEDGEAGGEVYSAATTTAQAKIVWEVAGMMMKRRPEFAAKIGVTAGTYAILHRQSGSKFSPLSREANNQDGLNIHVAIIDELHAHKTRETYDVIETGAGKRTNSLIWVITTAGSDTSGICYETRTYVKKVLGGLEDDTQFGIIYTMDEDDDWTAPVTWQKANPNWGVSVMPDTFAALAFKAMQTPAAQANFKTKHLDVWVNADAAAFDMAAWDRCTDLKLSEEQFAGEPCVIGLDLASKVDIAAVAKLFMRTPDGPTEPGVPRKPHYYLFVDCFLPEDAITDGRNAQYGGWAIEGRLTTTPGDVLDFATVKECVLDASRRFVVREVAYDPYQALQLAQEVQAQGITTIEVRPTVLNFSSPMKELDALMRSGRLHHDGNPVMRWMLSNTVGKLDNKDNIYPRKERPENKIDGVVAAIMALGRAMMKPVEVPKPRIRKAHR